MITFSMVNQQLDSQRPSGYHTGCQWNYEHWLWFVIVILLVKQAVDH